ncbi:hypothetical protein ACFWA9_18680 [Kitasatospora sp. NPDC059973]
MIDDVRLRLCDRSAGAIIAESEAIALSPDDSIDFIHRIATDLEG